MNSTYDLEIKSQKSQPPMGRRNLAREQNDSFIYDRNSTGLTQMEEPKKKLSGLNSRIMKRPFGAVG
jgi:hypothetical protein